MQGEQAAVYISGRNAQRALFCTLNMHTGHRIVMAAHKAGQDQFQAFLRLLRRRYRHRPIWMLLDHGPAHTAIKSQRLAQELDITLVWLPKQCPELNAVDHFWKAVRAAVSANYQHIDIEAHRQRAIDYALVLSSTQTRTMAGIMSKNFWLKRFL